MKSFALYALLAATTILALPTVATGTDALAPNVKSYPITTGCTQFPGYSAGSNTTDPFVLLFVQSKAPVNGNGLTSINYYDDDKARYIIPVSNQLAKVVVRCDQTASGPNAAPSLEVFSGGDFIPLQVFGSSSDPNAGNAQLVYGAAANASQPARAFAHDKAAKKGIFIGAADGSTNFAAQLEFESDSVYRSFWYLRYVPTGGRLGKAESAGFVQVNGS